MSKGLGLTLYTVLGPRVSKRFDGKEFHGGWSFLEKSIELIEAQLTKDIELSVEIRIAHHKSFGTLEGLSIRDKSDKLKISVSSIDFLEESADREIGSSQHGLLLNTLIRRNPPSTSFYGVIDPDCYLLDIEGLVSILQKMEKEEISTIGVSYPNTFPPHYYWDFPVAYFQIFSRRLVRSNELDFLPSAEPPQVRRFHSLIESHGVVKKQIRVIAIKFMDWFRLSKIAYLRSLSITAYFILEHQYTAARDTGYNNRKTFSQKSLSSLTLPVYFEQNKVRLPFFRNDEYANLNPEVTSVFDPATHFLFHGLYENREIGGQRLIYRLIVRLIRRGGSVDKSIHPMSSVVCSSDSNSREKEVLLREISSGGYLYLYNGHPFCVHLSHTAKKNLEKCLRYIDWLSQIIDLERLKRR